MHRLDRKLPYSKVRFRFFFLFKSKSFIFLAVIHHQLESNKRSADNFLFKYVLEHAKAYNIQTRKRNSVRIVIHQLIIFLFLKSSG